MSVETDIWEEKCQKHDFSELGLPGGQMITTYVTSILPHTIPPQLPYKAKTGFFCFWPILPYIPFKGPLTLICVCRVYGIPPIRPLKGPHEICQAGSTVPLADWTA